MTCLIKIPTTYDGFVIFVVKKAKERIGNNHPIDITEIDKYWPLKEPKIENIYAAIKECVDNTLFYI